MGSNVPLYENKMSVDLELGLPPEDVRGIVQRALTATVAFYDMVPDQGPYMDEMAYPKLVLESMQDDGDLSMYSPLTRGVIPPSLIYYSYNSSVSRTGVAIIAGLLAKSAGNEQAVDQIMQMAKSGTICDEIIVASPGRWMDITDVNSMEESALRALDLLVLRMGSDEVVRPGGLKEELRALSGEAGKRIPREDLVQYLCDKHEAGMFLVSRISTIRGDLTCGVVLPGWGNPVTGET